MDYFHLLSRETSLKDKDGSYKDVDSSGKGPRSPPGGKSRTMIMQKLNYFSVKGLENMLEGSSIIDDDLRQNESESKVKEKATSEVLALDQSLFTSGKRNKAKAVGENVPCALESFSDLRNNRFRKHIVEILRDSGITSPTLVQKFVIPILGQRRDLIVRSPTGSGKTLAFLLPIISDLYSSPKPEKRLRAVIISPTRELCIQLTEEARKISVGRKIKIKNLCRLSLRDPQREIIDQLERCDIIISNPAKLSKVVNTGLHLNSLIYLVLDEGDKLLSKNFLDQMTNIIKDLPKKTSKSLFSATTTSFVEEIAQHFLNDPVKVFIGKPNAPPASGKHKLVFVGSEDGKLLEIRKMIQEGIKLPVLIFVQSIQRANQLFREFIYDEINVGVTHSDRTKAQRDRTMQNFKEGNLWVLITSELVSRGMDFKNVNLVINFDCPQSVESYLHRAGRTSRGGKEGDVVTFFTQDDFPYLRGIASAIKASGNECMDWITRIPKSSKNEIRKARKRPLPACDAITSVIKKTNSTTPQPV